MINGSRIFFPLFLSCISCAACFFQQGYLDYFFLFIRNNEPETIDEDDTLEAGSLPNFRSGIHVKLPQRLLFVSTLETRAIFFFFFFFSFPPPIFHPEIPYFFPFPSPVWKRKKITAARFHPSFFFCREVTSFVDRRRVRFRFLFFLFFFSKIYRRETCRFSRQVALAHFSGKKLLYIFFSIVQLINLRGNVLRVIFPISCITNILQYIKKKEGKGIPRIILSHRFHSMQVSKNFSSNY